jgi:hypothetical protein
MDSERLSPIALTLSLTSPVLGSCVGTSSIFICRDCPGRKRPPTALSPTGSGPTLVDSPYRPRAQQSRGLRRSATQCPPLCGLWAGTRHRQWKLRFPWISDGGPRTQNAQASGSQGRDLSRNRCDVPVRILFIPRPEAISLKIRALRCMDAETCTDDGTQTL